MFTHLFVGGRDDCINGVAVICSSIRRHIKCEFTCCVSDDDDEGSWKKRVSLNVIPSKSEALPY